MNRLISLIILLISVLNVMSIKTVLAAEYTNPVGDMTEIGDPFVIKSEGKYYMYATSVAN